MTDHGDALDMVQRTIGYHFSDSALLTTALTHSSYASENEVDSYERLEFLGDAVLELAITLEIFGALDDASEGRMTRIRATIVDEATLASVARRIGLPAALRLGVGEDRSGGRDRVSIQSDVVESVLGAVYLDGGAQASLDVVLRLLGETVADRLASSQVSDSRSMFQEHLARKGQVVSFDYERSGPDHSVVYTATASVDGHVVGTGTGASKKTAAIDAARDALAFDV
ncbi:MAG: ribonuclease III [Acidimicrobiia bacterium]